MRCNTALKISSKCSLTLCKLRFFANFCLVLHHLKPLQSSNGGMDAKERFCTGMYLCRDGMDAKERCFISTVITRGHG